MTQMSRRALGAAAVLMIAGSAAFAQAPANPPVRVRATIEKLDGNKLMVKNTAGQDMTINLPDNVRVLGVDKTTIADVKVGNYVGISSMPQPDGSQKAIHVHIFPDAMRGVAEGHFPWDNRPGSMMTNAAVETTVSGNDGQTLTVKYKDGEKKVVVPPDAIIAKYVPGQMSDLKPGAKIFIAGAQRQPDGSLNAANVSVGVGGFVPPM
jgi:outer membrane lipoprotein SlyB